MEIPFNMYKKMIEINWSKLKLLRESDKAFLNLKDKEVKPTESMEFGTKFHKFYLENKDFFNEYKIKEDIVVNEPLDIKNKEHLLKLQGMMEKDGLLKDGILNMRTKAHKEMVRQYIEEFQPTVDTLLNTRLKSHKQYIEDNKIKLVSSYEMYLLKNMKDSMVDYGMTVPDLTEFTLLGKIRGIDVKCRIDYLDDKFGGDVKTIKRGIIANDKLLYWTIINSGYHLQALFYMIIARQNGYNVDTWYLDFIEKDEPFQSRRVVLDYLELESNYGDIIYSLINRLKMINSGMISKLQTKGLEDLRG